MKYDLCYDISHILIALHACRLNDMISTKQKLTRQSRDSEEEIHEQRQKIESLRQDVRKAEKQRRQIQTQLEESQSEASKQLKLRERSEQFCAELEQEIENHKQRLVGRPLSGVSLSDSQEACKLRAEIEKQSVEHEEELGLLQAKHNAEVSCALYIAIITSHRLYGINVDIYIYFN